MWSLTRPFYTDLFYDRSYLLHLRPPGLQLQIVFIDTSSPEVLSATCGIELQQTVSWHVQGKDCRFMTALRGRVRGLYVYASARSAMDIAELL